MEIKYSTLSTAVFAALFSTAAVADFGTDMDAALAADAYDLFGVNAPLAASASTHTARATGQVGSDLVSLASGLSATILTRNAANHTDMFDFWPVGSSNPTHLISCVEGTDAVPANNGKKNPSVQRIELGDADGDGTPNEVETILRGMTRCDGIRTTAWGTVLATEENDDGGAYEIIDPLNVSEHTVLDRAVGTIVEADGTTAATKVVKRVALPTMAWEGLVVLSTGVVIGGDELKPGSDNGIGTDGGAIFKFVPNSPHDGSAITSLSQSPLAGGSVYALQVSCNSGDQTYGQGCEVGNGAWVSVNAATARADANTNGATGYYRPEDLHTDPTYVADAATPNAIRFCWANTGSESAKHYGEVVCGVDSNPTSVTGRTVAVNRFVEGDTQLNAVDNLAFQPVSGNLAVIEDHTNGDVWMCLPDGADRDIKSDGCIRILSVKDQSAEPTGFAFSPDGTKAYVSIQHSTDDMLVDGYGTDDLLVITGFANPSTLSK